MLRDTIEFRRQYGVNGILEEASAREAWKVVRPMFTAVPVMFTNEGNIVIYFQMADFLRIWQKGISEEHLRTFYISWMERTLRLQARGRARLGRGEESEMPGCIEVYNLEGMGLSHLRCVAGLRLMLRILRIGQDHYPENLHTAIMLNMPAMAYRPLRMVQGVLDAGTQAKMRFAKDDGRTLLREVLGVEPEELTQRYGSALSSGFSNDHDLLGA